jgi:putative FmdB family regulatory protein
MPIYEFLCVPCNRVYSFMTASYDTSRVPACPKCGATDMHRQVSAFAFVRGGAGKAGRGEAGADDGGLGDDFGPGGGPDLDDPRVEREMMRLMADAEHMDENDPRQLGRMMRRMSEITGEPMDEEMEEAVRRLEAGEDPERIEDDLGDLGLGGEGGMGGSLGGPPSYDDDLYSF